jgi:hypothetical protein
MTCGLLCFPCLGFLGSCLVSSDLISCWQGKFGRELSYGIWAAVPHCLLWCLWRERNLRIFEDGDQSTLDLRLLLLRTLFDWMTANGCFHSILS